MKLTFPPQLQLFLSQDLPLPNWRLFTQLLPRETFRCLKGYSEVHWSLVM